MGRSSCPYSMGYLGAYSYQPLHIYEGQSGKLITTILRPGVRPDGKQIVTIREAVSRLYSSGLAKGGDSFCEAMPNSQSPEVQDFCATKDLFFILGQSANTRLLALGKAPDGSDQKPLCTNRQARATFYLILLPSPDLGLCLDASSAKLKSPPEATNTRFVVTNLESSRASFIYQNIYCARGQMENFIKNHKTFLHSDRTSCHAFGANQFRLFLHSAAYVLLHTLAHIGLQGTTWINAQVNTPPKSLP